ncbi:hypothetical protein G7054_g8210 [Neopestalotiopsis clavispora]|nr:hypothetical protein G7054_g8210 [Neopestalotiopsis clavispora]
MNSLLPFSQSLALLLLLIINTIIIPKCIAFPTCGTTAPAQDALNFTTAALSLDHHPFGIAYYTNDIAFVVIRRSIGVLDMSGFAPVLKHTVEPSRAALAHLGLSDDQPDSDDYIFHGLVLSPDRRALYAAGGYGALVLDPERAAGGQVNTSVVGVLANNGIAGNYSAMVAVTPDSRTVFLTQEFGSIINGHRGNVEVWKVAQGPNGLMTGVYGGFVNLGYATVGMAFSRDGSKLYVTSEMTGLTDSLGGLLEGSISVLDIATLQTNPADAVLYTVSAGCHPVRIIPGTGGNHVWVSTRESNSLMVYDADKLECEDTAADALVSIIQVGTSPVSLAAVGDFVLTADSNRWGYDNTTTGLSVVSTSSVAQGKLVNYPQIPTGLFPREFGLSPDGKTLLVSEFDGYSIRAVDVSALTGQGASVSNGTANHSQRTLRYRGFR